MRGGSSRIFKVRAVYEKLDSRLRRGIRGGVIFVGLWSAGQRNRQSRSAWL